MTGFAFLLHNVERMKMNVVAVKILPEFLTLIMNQISLNVFNFLNNFLLCRNVHKEALGRGGVI